MFQENKSIFIFLAVFLLIAGAGIARWKFFPSFFRTSPPAPSVVSPAAAPSSLPSLETKNEVAPAPSRNPASASNALSGVPAYSGRDPEEVLPLPASVKLFNDEQKNAIYSNIQVHGRSVKINSEFFTGWIELGLLKKIIGDYAGARDAWEYAGLLQPKNSLSFANLGELYWHYLPDFPKAEANLKISIQHKPEDIQTHVTLAELYHYSYTAKHDLAPTVLLDGLKSNPGEGTLMRRLAYLYEQREEWGKALEWWQRVLVKSPNDSEVQGKIDALKRKLESVR